MFIDNRCSQCSETLEVGSLVLLDDPVDFAAAQKAYEADVTFINPPQGSKDFVTTATCVDCACQQTSGQEWFSAQQWEDIGEHPIVLTHVRVAQEWMH